MQVAEETAHLAPHGVPSNPIPRALSSSRLHDLASDQSYGATYNTSGGNLDIPGAGGNMGGGREHLKQILNALSYKLLLKSVVLSFICMFNTTSLPK